MAKNELQRLRNIARSKNTKVPGVGLTPTTKVDAQTSNDLKKASELAKKSTASLGKFQDKLPSALEKQVKPTKGKKRKFDSVTGSSNEEKAKNLKVLDQITSKKGKLDVTKGVGQHINTEEKGRADEKKQGNKKQGRGGKVKKGSKAQKRKGNFNKKGSKGQGGGRGGAGSKKGRGAAPGGKKK